MTTSTPPFPAESLGLQILERGWLSSNIILIASPTHTALIDSGYATHSAFTLSWIDEQLKARVLNDLVNTHLHSDHCGGNAALQKRYPALRTHIPKSQAEAVSRWDDSALTFAATGQQCPAFGYEALLSDGMEIKLGTAIWEVHSSKGHDPHSVVLFNRTHRVLVSADALWQNGFGVVFPELEGISAFEEVSETLDTIQELNPQWVIPGHGAIFKDVSEALLRARNRLEQFTESPQKHRRYALKVLLKFKLLEWQAVSRINLEKWIETTAYFSQVALIDGINIQNKCEKTTWLDELLSEMERSGAIEIDEDLVRNGT